MKPSHEAPSKDCSWAAYKPVGHCVSSSVSLSMSGPSQSLSGDFTSGMLSGDFTSVSDEATSRAISYVFVSCESIYSYTYILIYMHRYRHTYIQTYLPTKKKHAYKQT